MKPDDIVTGKVETLSFSGEGIIKNSGFVLFVPFTAPNDLVSCKITEVKKNYGRAIISAILKKSEERTEPKCAFFGTCGGCQLQHINYETQTKSKCQWIKDALTRIGKYDDVHVSQVISSEKIYAYRRHITLSIKNQKIGYTGTDGHSFVEVTECPIFIEKENHFLKQLQAVVTQFEIKDEGARVTVLKQELGGYLLHFHFKNLPSNAKHVIENALNLETAVRDDKVMQDFELESFTGRGRHSLVVKAPPTRNDSGSKDCVNLSSPTAVSRLKLYLEIKGVILSSKQGTVKFGLIENSYCIDDLNFSFSSDSFMQNNKEQSVKIYRHLVKIAKESSAKEILDLYCGIGISSLLLAKTGAHVTGIEVNHRSIKMAIKNAKINGLHTKTKFIHAAVEGVLENIKIPDFVIINPPREGLDQRVIIALKKRLPKKIVYISCMPSTLARDLSLFGKENYTIEECQPYDMFPQTTHIETIIILTLNGSSRS